MILCEFRFILVGAELHIHTDHKNILNIKDSSQRRLQWISYVNEYGPELHYVEGSANVIADTFSRLSQKDTPTSSAVGRNDPLSILFTKMMSMRHLLITISHGLMPERCLNAMHIFLTKIATSTYQLT